MPRRDIFRGPIYPSARVAWARGSLPVVLAGALALHTPSCKPASAPPPSADDVLRYHDRTFKVARVIDGDTLDIAVPDAERAITRVRLWGVDAPEVGHRGAADAYFGSESTDFAERTLEGRDVHIVLVPGSTRGHFGRLLAYVYLERGGPMFNEMLIEQGYAYADPRFDHPHCDRFMAIERAAREARRGLWARVTVEQMPEWRQSREPEPAVSHVP